MNKHTIFLLGLVLLCLGACDTQQDADSDGNCLGGDSLCGSTNESEDLRPAKQDVIDALSISFEGSIENANSASCKYTDETFVMEFHSFSELTCGNEDCADALVGEMTFGATLEIGEAVFEFEPMTIYVTDVDIWSLDLKVSGTSSDSETAEPILMFWNDSNILGPDLPIVQFLFAFSSSDAEADTAETTDKSGFSEACYLNVSANRK